MKALIITVMFACAVTTATAGIVTNGDFETCTFAGWTKSGNPSLLKIISNTVTSNHTFLWRSGATGSLAYISQTLDTVAGATYELQFGVFNSATSNSIFQADFDGITVYGFSNEVHDLGPPHDRQFDSGRHQH